MSSSTARSPSPANRPRRSTTTTSSANSIWGFRHEWQTDRGRDRAGHHGRRDLRQSGEARLRRARFRRRRGGGRAAEDEWRHAGGGAGRDGFGRGGAADLPALGHGGRGGGQGAVEAAGQGPRRVRPSEITHRRQGEGASGSG